MNRDDFPILSRRVYDKPLVYFDNAATTQKPRCVVEAIEHAYYHVNANVHRGVHFLSQAATEAQEEARKKVQRFIGAAQSREIIFTRGTTEGINLVASSFGEAYMQAGDEVILSTMEHHANIVPWQLLRERKGIVIRVIPLTQTGELDMEAYASLLNPRTRMVALTHASNVLATINPLPEIIRLAHEHDIPVLIDGAQGVPHTQVDVTALDVDFYLFSAHKIYGPTGIGVLYGKEKWLEQMPPYQGGGEMIQRVTFEKTTYNHLPYKFEAGTPDYIGVVALAAALDYIEAIGMERIAAHETDLLHYATRRLSEIEGIALYGQAPHRCSLISFGIEGIHAYDIGLMLDKQGIAIRTGHHCAQPLMQYLGLEGTARASFGLYNTSEEIDQFIHALQRIKALFA